MVGRPALAGAAAWLAACLFVAGCGGSGAHQRTRPGSDAAHDADVAGVAAGWSVIGRSVRGRPIEAVTRGHGRSRIYVIGGIHGDEPEGLAVAAALAAPGRTLASATVRIVRDMNPDGTAAGTRANSRGVDLNRNWPAYNFVAGGGRGNRALSEPETRAVHADLLRFRPDAVVVLHSARAGPFVNFDGPALSLAEQFVEAAGRNDPRWRVVARMGYDTPGSIGTLIGVDRRLPILTVEFRRGDRSARGREAASAGLWAVFGTGGARSTSVGTPRAAVGETPGP
ncbi:MAG: M14 family zinc carboxypeptidase [Phycisphaerales bacterium]